MTSIKLKKESTTTNTAKGTFKAKVDFFKGNITGNMIDEQPVVSTSPCAVQSLDFSCQDNSQYVPLI